MASQPVISTNIYYQYSGTIYIYIFKTCLQYAKYYDTEQTFKEKNAFAHFISSLQFYVAFIFLVSYTVNFNRKITWCM